MKRILILGGTIEARLLAASLAGRPDFAVTVSLAGRTAEIVAQNAPTRIGGFGGVAGLVDYLDRELPTVRTTRPEGGYFLWAELDGVDAGELLARAEDSGVTFVKGTDFGGDPDTLRLAYSFVSVDEIADGVGRLAAALPAAV